MGGAAQQLLWGVIAAPARLEGAFLIAAASMLAGAATIRLWPLVNTEGMDRSTVVYWPEPQLVLSNDLDSGEMAVRTVYNVSPETEKGFLEVMAFVRQTKLRTGATRWGLYRDAAAPNRFEEVFSVSSWEEHLRQHRDRLTGFDRQADERANTYSDPPPETLHLIEVDVPD